MKKFKNGVLYQGDCLEIMPTLPAQSVDMILTSPPYDNLRTYGNKNLLPWDFEGVAREIWRVIKPGGVVVWIVGDATVKGSETGTSFKQALFFKEIGFNLHDTMIWNKGMFSAVGALSVRYAPVFEYMFVLSKGKIRVFNPIKDRITKEASRRPHKGVTQRLANGSMRRNLPPKVGEYGQRYNIWDVPPCISSTERTGHPAQFPLGIAVGHVRSWSNPGDVVLDPFAGSGTTGEACGTTGRRFVLIEREKEYCEIIKKRVAR